MNLLVPVFASVNVREARRGQAGESEGQGGFSHAWRIFNFTGYIEITDRFNQIMENHEKNDVRKIN